LNRYHLLQQETHVFYNKCSVRESVRSDVLLYASKKTKNEFFCAIYKKVKGFCQVDDLPERGKTRITTKKTGQNNNVKFFEKHPTYNLRQTQKILSRKGVKVSLQTIKRRDLSVMDGGVRR